jgi:hypothetical protein
VGEGYDEATAYEECVDNTLSTFLGDRSDDVSLVVYQPPADAQIVRRKDGNFYLYIEVDNHTLDTTHPELVSAGAAECVVGPSIVQPASALYGATIRSAPESRDPEVSIVQYD